MGAHRGPPPASTRGQPRTFESYADCLITSGAIQKGVPTNVCRLLVVLVSWPATPKSASFTSPSSESSTLAAEGGTGGGGGGDVCQRDGGTGRYMAQGETISEMGKTGGDYRQGRRQVRRIDRSGENSLASAVVTEHGEVTHEESIRVIFPVRERSDTGRDPGCVPGAV